MKSPATVGESRVVGVAVRFLALLYAIPIGGALAAVGAKAAAVAAVFVVAVGAWFLAAARRDEPNAALSTRALALFATASWIANGTLLLVEARPHLHEWVVFGVGIACAVAAIVRPPRERVLVLGVVALGVALRISAYCALPLDPLRADMLPVIGAAVDRLRHGVDPYGTYRIASWEVPLVYLPGTWLPYLAPRVLGLDLRVINVLCELGTGVVIARFARSRQAVALWAILFVSPSTIIWSVNTEHPVFWLTLTITLALVGQQSWRAVAVALGFAGATSPLAAVIAPFVGLAWLRQLGVVRALIGAVIAAVVAAMFISPFWFWGPHAFVDGVFRWHNDNTRFPGIRWAQDRTWAHQLGLAGLFWSADAVQWMKPLQTAALCAIALVFWTRGAKHVAAFSVCALLCFVAFNPMVWIYLYWPAVLAALAAVGAGRSP